MLTKLNIVIVLKGTQTIQQARPYTAGNWRLSLSERGHGDTSSW